ncbi:MAG: YeeE/YedE family protein [Elusimicrobia bacterium]|nr:YeeE/YedE family protein [Elusimicrobiota bacterium]
MPPEFVHALAGGALIGAASILLLWTDGKIAGVSGVFGGLLDPRGRGEGWRWAFTAGLIAGGLALRLAGRTVFAPLPGRSIGALVAAGLLVGLGTQLGSGCTSGHGVCGLGRRSPRSLAAVLTFMAAGAAAVYVVGHVLRGNA